MSSRTFYRRLHATTGTANNLRHHFLKHVGVSPSDHRQAFLRR